MASILKTDAQLGVAATLIATTAYNQTTSTGVSNTGNDYIVVTTSGVTEKMNVAVCDGTVPQMMWTYTVTGSALVNGNIQLVSSDAFDPDVCLLYRNNRFFAVVVYSDPVVGASYVECYAYTAATNTWALTTQINQTVLGVDMETAINVDSDQKEHFAIVWDVESTASNTHCYIVAGKWSTTFLEPVICSITNPGVLLPPLKNSAGTFTLSMPYKMPDIGVFDESNSVADYVITVIDHDYDIATYAQIRQNIVCNNNMPGSYPYDFYRSDAVRTFLWPRVARHRHVGTTLQEGYTVVYSDYDASGPTYDICGHTNFYDATIPAFVNTDNVYTDGSAFFDNGTSTYFLPSINNKTIYKPVVSYERQSGSTSPITSQHFVVAFNAVDGNSDIYPLAFYAYNVDGTPYTNVSIYDFNQVPILSSNPNDEQIISVAGEQSHVFLYSWYDNNAGGGTMSYKLVASGAKFRAGVFDNNESETNCLYFIKQSNSWLLLENMSKATNIHIYSLNGKTAFRQSHFETKVFINALHGLIAGMYVTSFSINGQTQNLKLIVQ